MSVILGTSDIAFIVDSTGTFSLGGLPILDTMSPSAVAASLVSDTDSFPAPAISSSIGLSASLYSDADVVYSPTIVAAAGALAPVLFSDSDTFYVPVVAAGAVTLQPPLVSDADIVYAPSIAIGAVTLLPPLVSDAESIYATSVTAAVAGALVPALLVDADAIFAASIRNAVQFLTPALVTDADVVYAPIATAGAPILLPSRVVDADVFFAAVVGQDKVLRPALFIDPETVYPAYSIDTAKLPHDQRLRAGTLNDADVIFAARLSLSPLVVFDADVIYAPIGFAYYGLSAPFVVDADAFPAANVGVSVPLGLVQDDDAIYSPTLSLFLVPQLVADSDAIPAADVGWKVFAEFVDYDDLIYSVHVDTFNGLFPAIYIEDDHLQNYPFRVQALTGGVPVPKPPGILTGSIVSDRRRLTGSVDNRPRLTGSVQRKGRVLTGSVRRK